VQCQHHRHGKHATVNPVLIAFAGIIEGAQIRSQNQQTGDFVAEATVSVL
jgi:hypothetical protein